MELEEYPLLKSIIIGLIVSLLFSALYSAYYGYFGLIPIQSTFENPFDYSLKIELSIVLVFCIVFYNITIWYYCYSQSNTDSKKSMYTKFLPFYILVECWFYFHFWSGVGMMPSYGIVMVKSFYTLVVVGFLIPFVFYLVWRKVR